MFPPLTAVTKVSTSVAMASANTEYSFALTPRMRNITLQLRSASVAWRFSWTTGEVAGGAGTQVGAGFGVRQERATDNTAIYFAAGSASQTMDITYETETEP